MSVVGEEADGLMCVLLVGVFVVLVGAGACVLWVVVGSGIMLKLVGGLL